MCLTTHALPQHAPLIRNQVVLSTGAEHWVCVVLHGAVRAWSHDGGARHDGFLVPAGGVLFSPGLTSPLLPSRAWTACVRGVRKVTVESATAVVAVVNVDGAHPRMETAWVAAQVLVDKEDTVRAALNAYTAQLQWAVRRLQQSLGWLPAFQARVRTARSRWRAAVAALRQRRINGTVPRLLFGALPATEGLLERIHKLEVLPLEEKLRHVRRQAVQRQQLIRDVLARWRTLQPLPDDPHQPPATVDASDLSHAFVEDLEGRMQAVRQR